ncbi:MAG: CBS domain-containing protein [Acidobacteria bacterium]|nr:CBS domain-containing protein [Acidobacteriota bacterium]
MTTTVRDMLVGKTAIHAVEPGVTVFDALRVMATHNIGAVLVSEGSRLVGIFSERDYARKVALLGKASRDLAVSEVMTSDVVTVAPWWTADQCMALMTERRVRHLPVFDGDRLVGLVSIGDVVRAVLAEQQRTIEELEHYITSGG